MNYQFSNGSCANAYVEVLKDVVKNPKKYTWVANVPSRLEAIENLKKLDIPIKFKTKR